MATTEKFPCDKPCPLLVKTRKLLNSDRRTLFEISKKSGLPFYWLNDFKRARTDGASVNRVYCLYEYLSGRKIKT